MKNLATVLSGLSLVGVIVLFVIVFQSKKEDIKVNSDNVVLKDSTKTEIEKREATGRIALIDVQRITNEYGYYKEIVEKLQKKQKRGEAELTRKSEAFKKKYETYMKKAQMGSFLSQQSQQSQEQELQQENQDLQMLQQQLSTQLQNEMQQLDAQATDTIMNYLKKFNLDAKYDLILNSATILDPGVTEDITDTILHVLNTQYELHKPIDKTK